MKNVSKASTRFYASPKTLVVIPEKHQAKILPLLNKYLSSPAKTIGNSIYAVLDIPKGQVKFAGMETCDIIGA